MGFSPGTRGEQYHGTPAQPPYGFDDWLAAEREAADIKHEYQAGQVYAMTGASLEHNIIAANLTRELGNRLEGRSCLVLAGDMRLRIEAADTAQLPRRPGGLRRARLPR